MEEINQLMVYQHLQCKKEGENTERIDYKFPRISIDMNFLKKKKFFSGVGRSI